MITRNLKGDCNSFMISKYLVSSETANISRLPEIYVHYFFRPKIWNCWLILYFPKRRKIFFYFSDYSHSPHTWIHLSNIMFLSTYDSPCIPCVLNSICYSCISPFLISLVDRGIEEIIFYFFVLEIQHVCRKSSKPAFFSWIHQYPNSMYRHKSWNLSHVYIFY
jgi:hypothetical protein